MRAKTERLVITFHTTTEAMAMEKSCLEAGLRGRLIPVPREISAGCGLAWSSPAAMEGELLEHMKGRGLKFESCGIYMI